MAIVEWSKGYTDPFWDDEYKKLNYAHEQFNNREDLSKWKRQGYTHPDSHYTGELCDMRKPQPSWNKKIIDWANQEHNLKDVGTSYYRMSTGVILPTHGDTYKAYRRIFNCELHNCYRIIIFLEDWQSGHYFEIDNTPISAYPAGTWVKWVADTTHMAANLGITNRYTLQITGHK